MKKIFLLIVLCFSALVGRSQDVIVTNKGKEIKSTIIETNAESVRFKIFNENDKQICSIKQKIKQFKKQNLPVGEQVLTLPKKEVFMIEYENGKSDIYKDEVNFRTAKNVLNFIDVNSDPEAYKLYRDQYKNYYLSRGLIGAGGGLLSFGTAALLYNKIANKYSNSTIGGAFFFVGTGFALLVAGLELNQISSKKMEAAFSQYRKSLKTAQAGYHLDFGMTQNGVGLQMKF